MCEVLSIMFGAYMPGIAIRAFIIKLVVINFVVQLSWAMGCPNISV